MNGEKHSATISTELYSGEKDLVTIAVEFYRSSRWKLQGCISVTVCSHTVTTAASKARITEWPVLYTTSTVYRYRLHYKVFMGFIHLLYQVHKHASCNKVMQAV